MDVRNDGLLRGSREERIQEVTQLQNNTWDFDTLLGIIQGFLDHGENVREASMETLYQFAKRKPEPIHLTPTLVIEYFMFAFTAASNVAQRTFKFLVENSDQQEISKAVKRALLKVGRNEDFEAFINIIVASGKSEFLKVFEDKDLSKAKRQILMKACNSSP